MIVVAAKSVRPLAVLLLGMLLVGCTTLPPTQSVSAETSGPVMRAVMERKNRIVSLPSSASNRVRPALLLLHGATDDPSEMMAIVQQWHATYDVFLYSYNYHERVGKLAADLVTEIHRLQADGRLAGELTVVTYSYSAIIFRQAVIQAESRATFADARLIQLVPTAGGSRRALGMGIPFIGTLAGLASKPSAAQNPFGRFARSIWEGGGNRKFYEVIPPARMYSVRVEGDSHSLAGLKFATIQRRYWNGIGRNVVTIPKSTGVTHEYFPTHPVALSYLREIMESLPVEEGVATRETDRDHSQASTLSRANRELAAQVNSAEAPR
ncbi:MAG: hypothetical protein KIS67_16700 [Verrucomicrobiae bacterium]|nr:hypothetical protein [Verrucomicrobiae bacterium]